MLNKVFGFLVCGELNIYFLLLFSICFFITVSFVKLRPIDFDVFK